MRHLVDFRVFESSGSGLTQEQEEFLNECTRGTWTYNSSTGLVDVVGSFDCRYQGLRDFKGVRFGEVGGYFSCPYNQLTSLKGAPQKVEGDFVCRNNRLTTLEGAPQEVGGNFNCYGNSLTSLKGAPQEVGVSFYCGAFELGKGEWNHKGWLGILAEGSSKAQKLILTLMSTELLNKQIKQDPAGMIIKLKEVWNDESFREIRSKLVWPRGYEEEADLVGDLDDIGF